MYKYLFGPVPSRRLGMSLGVDLVPKKVCSLDCVYCEVGLTTKRTTKRKEYIPFDKVTSELDHYFANNPDPDYITFSGYGEPTLNLRIGDVIHFIKRLKPMIPVAVLTNGTMFYDEQVRDELKEADVVLPSFDAAIEDTFQKLNRPSPQLSVQGYLKGLIDFRNEFPGLIWLEVFIIPGLNDNTENLSALKNAIESIGPDRVQLNTLDRPGAVEGIRAASREELQNIVDFWKIENVEIIAVATARKKIRAYRNDTEYTILGTISRRPCTPGDLRKILGLHLNEINKYLEVLEEEGKIEAIRQERGLFYQVK